MSIPSIDPTIIDDVQKLDKETITKLLIKVYSQLQAALDEKQASSQEETTTQLEAPTGDAEPDGECYPLNGKPGCVLIISNACEEDRSQASEADFKAMYDLWVKTIGCKQHDQNEENPSHKDMETQSDYQNQTAKNMKHLLKTLADTQNEYSYIVVIISTHGALVTESYIKKCEKREKKYQNSTPKEFAKKSKKAHDKYFNKTRTCGNKTKNQLVPVFFGEHWQPVRETEMFELFYNEKNPNLLNKPKFFILDYCRSEPEYKTKAKNKKAVPDNNVTYKTVTPKLPVLSSAMPIMSDMIKAYATHHSHAAIEYKDEGSWLTTAIADVFKSNYNKKGVVEMLTLVNARVKELSSGENRKDREAMSLFESSLVKEFRLYDKRRQQVNTQSFHSDAQPSNSNQSQSSRAEAKDPEGPKAEGPKSEQQPSKN